MRWIFRIVGVLVVVILIAVATFFLVPADRIAALVEDRFEAATGRALSVTGDVRPSLWPGIGVNTGPVTIANADWAGSDPMIEAEGLSVGVAWAGLLGGDVQVTGVELVRPVIRLSQAVDGRVNWDMGAPSQAETTEAAAAPALSLDEARVSDGTVIYAAEGSPPLTLSGINATLTLPDFAGEARLDLTAQANGEAISASVTIAAFEAFLASGAPVSLLAEIGGGSLRYAGSVGLAPMAVQGQLTADLAGLGPLTRAAGAEAAMPPGLGQERIAVETALAFDGETLGLSDLGAQLDENALSGDLALALGGARPRLTGSLAAGALDLSRLSGDDPAEDTPASDGGWSTEPIDVSGLGAIDTDLSVAADSIRLADSQFGRTSLHIGLDDRRLVTTINELVAYDGAVAGQMVVNGRGGLSASADLSGSAIAISRLFAELLDFDRLVALGDMDISVLASGASMNGLMNGLNGEGSFRFGAGELLGLDLVGMLRNFDTAFVGEGKATIFDEITGTFRIVDGVVVNENLQFLAPLLTATGAGRVNLGGQTLDYRIVPKLLQGEGEGISVPLLITGTWAAPSFRLDLEGLAEERAKEELEKVKDDLEDKAKEELQERLGIGDGEGGSVEDQLKKGLRSLFD
ncbi:MAG: AsmA family protein [Pseudomonadota bacterium]